MSWFNLLTPSAAVIAIFLAIALVIQSFRHGRQIRRLEQQIASSGLTAYDPTLERLKALSGLSDKKDRVRGRRRRPPADRQPTHPGHRGDRGRPPDRRGRRVGGHVAQQLVPGKAERVGQVHDQADHNAQDHLDRHVDHARRDRLVCDGHAGHQPVDCHGRDL